MSLNGSTVNAPAASGGITTANGVRKQLSWRSAFVLSLGGTLLVNVSLGAMAAEIGAASIAVWAGTAGVGVLLCLLLAELASRFPHKVGGAPAYVHEGFKGISPLFGAVATWSYWVAWIPGVAVNLTLAATYLEAAFLPGVNVAGLTLGLAVVLYALNSLGLRPSVWLSGFLAVGALLPIGIIVAAPLVRPALWQGANFSPLLPDGAAPWSPPALALLAKWAFVAVWSSYGAEMAATVVGELRDPARDIPKAIGAAAGAAALTFALVPTVLLALVGVDGLSQDPYAAFSTAAAAIFGAAGASLVGLMLIAVLILGAEVFVISSSRALYQMSRDGLTLQGYGKLNRRGVPVGSLLWDAAITLALLAIFGGDLVRVVAAANVGYLLVFIMLPLAYVLIRQRRPAERGSFHLPGVFVPIALAIAGFNAALLLVGGAQWGAKTMGGGLALVLVCVPLSLARRGDRSRGG